MWYAIPYMALWWLIWLFCSYLSVADNLKLEHEFKNSSDNQIHRANLYCVQMKFSFPILSAFSRLRPKRLMSPLSFTSWRERESITYQRGIISFHLLGNTCSAAALSPCLMPKLSHKEPDNTKDDQISLCTSHMVTQVPNMTCVECLLAASRTSDQF